MLIVHPICLYIVRVEERGDRLSLTSMETQTSHHGVYKFCVHRVAIKDALYNYYMHTIKVVRKGWIMFCPVRRSGRYFSRAQLLLQSP
jgi:hypothetical protein